MDIGPFVRAGAGAINDGVRIGRHKAPIIPGEAGVDRPAVRHPVDRALPGSRHVWDGWGGNGLCRIAVRGKFGE